MGISENIIAQGAISESQKNILVARWNLLDACNYNCAYCHCPKNANLSVLLLDRLLGMAHRIFGLQRDQYLITLTGGEPAIHPFLREVTHYLLKSGRNVFLSIETNGSRSLNYYDKLLANLPAMRLRLVIGIHPAFADYSQILQLLAITLKNGQAAKAVLVNDPFNAQKTEAFLNMLVELRKNIPFALEILNPRWPGSLQAKIPANVAARLPEWRQTALKRFAENATASGKPANAWPKASAVFYDGCNVVETPDAPADFRGFNCCMELNYLQINPDGSYAGSSCGQAIVQPPLWDAPEDALHKNSVILKCAQKSCPGGTRNILPKFRSLVTAQNYRANFMPPKGLPQEPQLLDPVSLTPGAAQKTLLAWRRLKKNENRESKPLLTPNPDIFARRFEDITTVWNALADQPSRDALLRCVKALETGDGAWFACGPKVRNLPCPQKDDGLPFSEYGHYCDYIIIEGPAKLEQIKRFAGTIRQHQPALLFPLDLHHLIDAALWVAGLNAGYQIFLDLPDVNGLPRLIAAVPGRKPAKQNQGISGLVSVIISTFNSAATVRRCLDSAIAQGLEDLELIVLDGGSSDGTIKILQEYELRLGGKLRWHKSASNIDPGSALNAGLSMAKGEFIAFIESTAALAPGFIAKGREILTNEKADIAAFDEAILRNGKWSIRKVSPGEFSSVNSLEQLLLGKAGDYGTAGKMYRAEFLWRENISYGPMPVYYGTLFNIRSFLSSRKTIITSRIGCLHYSQQNSDDTPCYGAAHWLAFAHFISSLVDLFIDNGLDLNSEMLCYCVRSIYICNRARIFNSLTQEVKRGNLDKLVNKITVAKLGKIRQVLELFLADYALAWDYVHPANIQIRDEDVNWREAAREAVIEPALESYGNADTPFNTIPVLSVIVPNYNKDLYLDQSLRSILSQSMRDFELIIVDDASSDGSWDVLRDYADLDSRVRLYRLDRNSRQGVCRNIGMDKARGKYVIFVDSDDLCLPGYFAAAINHMQASNADLGIFSCQLIQENGKIWQRPLAPNKNYNRTEALLAFCESNFGPEPWGKIYKLETLRAGDCRFPAHVFHQDVPFCLEAIFASQSIFSSNQVVYQRVWSQNSSIRPDSVKYLHLHSAYKFYDFVNRAEARLAEDIVLRKWLANNVLSQIPWNLENVLLGKVAAFLRKNSQFPISDADYPLLAENVAFWRAMLAGIAKVCAPNISDDALVKCEQKPFVEIAPAAAGKPVVSVIMPVYDCENLLSRAVNSVLEQSLTALELLIVDDASKDNSWQLCKRFASRDGRVRIFRNESNKGQGWCRNFALSKTRGKYVAYVDADDICNEDMLLTGAALLESLPEGDFVQFAQAKDESFNDIYRAFEDISLVDGPTCLDLYARSKLYHHEMHSKLWRREFIEDIFLPEFLFEDTPFVLQAYSKANQIIFSPYPGYAYIKTEHPASAMKPARYTHRHLQGQLATYAWISDFFGKKNTPESVRQGQLLIKRFYGNFANALMPHLADLARLGINPLGDEHLGYLKSAPELLKLFFEDAAARWVKKTGHEPYMLPFTHNPAKSSSISSQWRQKDETICLTVIASDAINLGPLLEYPIADVEFLLLKGDRGMEISQNLDERVKIMELSRHSWDSETLNSAMTNSRGKYLMFLTEACNPPRNFLESAIGAICAHDVDLIAVGSSKNASSSQNALLNYFSGANPGALLFKREFIQEANLLFENHDLARPFFVIGAMLANPAYYSASLPAWPELGLPKPQTVSQADFENVLHGSARLLARAAEKNPDLLEAFEHWLFGAESGFLAIFLGYIHARAKQQLSSPIDDEIMAIFTESASTLKTLMSDLSVLFEKSNQPEVCHE